MAIRDGRLTAAQRNDADHFEVYWRDQVRQGALDLRVPPDEVMWQRDLGRARRVAFEWLGDLRGKRVIELGCGSGDNTVMLARRGARVIALDLAFAGAEITRERARVNNVAGIGANVMAAESLAFPDHTFDLAVGFGLLHHADLEALAHELRRVLTREGRAIFFEPLGTNPLLEFARAHLPYRAKHHSANEHPLTYADLERVGKYFRATRAREFYLFSMITRAVGSENSLPWLSSLDEFLIARLSLVRRWCRYVLVEFAL